jgi:hypothetical protein
MSSRLKVILRFSAFMLCAVGILLAGALGLAFLWGVTHHRYDMPDSGVYHGLVDGRFFYSNSTNGTFFSFDFRGETSPRWRWSYTTNITYRSLTIDWSGEPGHGTATVSLPSFSCQSSSFSGSLTRDTLAAWLLGTTNRPPSSPEVESVSAIFSYLEAAAKGALPAPRHHGYHFDEPMIGSIYHFLLGWGVPRLVYFWVALWLLLVVFFTPRFIRARDGIGSVPSCVPEPSGKPAVKSLRTP